MEKKTISVILPTYNRENIIGKTIESLLNQTYSDLEIIVVDDYSTDETERVVNSFDDPRVRYVKNNNRKGACAARNTGILASQGEYIAFQDSDDISRENRLEKEMSVLERYDADICFCNLHRHGYDSRYKKIHPDINEGIVSRKALLIESLVSTPTILAKRSVFFQNMFDEELEMWQDYDWIIRASENYNVCFCAAVLVDKYYQSDSITEKKRNSIIQTNQRLLEKYRGLNKQYPQLISRFLNNIISQKAIIGSSVFRESQELFLQSNEMRFRVKALFGMLGLLRLYYFSKELLLKRGIIINRL